MDACKNAVPVGFLSHGMYNFNMIMGWHLWNKLIDAGYDPEKLVAKFQEIGDGTLAVGFFENETDDIQRPLPGAGFILPMGFWYTSDRRMPLNWTGAKPPSGYGPPGIGTPAVSEEYYRKAAEATFS